MLQLWMKARVTHALHVIVIFHNARNVSQIAGPYMTYVSFKKEIVKMRT